MSRYGLRAYDKYDTGWEHAAERNARLPQHRYVGDAGASERCRATLNGEGQCGLLLDYAVHDRETA